MLHVPNHQRLGVRADTQAPAPVAWHCSETKYKKCYILFRLWTNGFITLHTAWKNNQFKVGWNMYFLEYNLSAFNLEQCRRKVLSFLVLRDQFCMYFFLTCTFLTQQLKNVFFFCGISSWTLCDTEKNICFNAFSNI